VLRTLSAVLSQAVEDALLPANPAFRMGKHPRPGDQPRAEIQPLSHAEAHHLVTAAKAYTPELWVFFLMAVRTGMRLGELLAVQWGDLDLMDRFVDVRRSLVGGRVTSTKNTNRRRVYLSLKLTEALRDHRTAEKARISRPAAVCRSGCFPTRRACLLMATTSAIASSMDSSSTRNSGRFASTTCGTPSRRC
jgi:integrase